MEMQFEDIDFYGDASQRLTLFTKKNSEKSESLYTHNGDEFIDMVLGIAPYNKPVEAPQQNILEQDKSENTCAVGDVISGGQTNSETSSKKSANHNCQKQTVSALKYLVSLENFNYLTSRENQVLQSLWKGFKELKSRKAGTINLLSCLFNVDKARTKDLESYGFKELFANFSQSQIQMAQEELRKVTIDCLCEDAINSYIYQVSSVSRKQNFYHYLMSFRQSLMEKSLKKRMTKKIAEQKAKVLKIYECLE